MSSSRLSKLPTEILNVIDVFAYIPMYVYTESGKIYFQFQGEHKNIDFGYMMFARQYNNRLYMIVVHDDKLTVREYDVKDLSNYNVLFEKEVTDNDVTKFYGYSRDNFYFTVHALQNKNPDIYYFDAKTRQFYETNLPGVKHFEVNYNGYFGVSDGEIYQVIDQSQNPILQMKVEKDHKLPLLTDNYLVRSVDGGIKIVEIATKKQYKTLSLSVELQTYHWDDIIFVKEGNVYHGISIPLLINHGYDKDKVVVLKREGTHEQLLYRDDRYLYFSEIERDLVYRMELATHTLTVYDTGVHNLMRIKTLFFGSRNVLRR